jgi:EmrB/QacA subfamily drug resistance transporter
VRITEENRRWWTLAGTCMALFVLMLDSTIVTLALPAIQRGLEASASELQWVVNGYLLTIAVLVVTAGRLGDQFGRRRVFVGGLATFAVGLVIAATAPGIEVLIVARFIQGIGAAGMLTLSLALVSSVFDDATRPRALGIWAGVSASALAFGPLVGGVLVDALSWRWVFWVGVIPLLLGLWWTLTAAPEVRDETASHRIDVPGLATLTVGLTAIVLVLIEGHDWGWDSARSVVVAVVGVVSLVAFVLIEPRVRQPVVEFDLFRNRPYLGASAAAFCLVGAWWAVIFYMPQYLQGPLGYGPAMSGVLTLPITAPRVVIAPLAPRLIARFGPRALMTTGMVCGALGVALMARLDDSSGYLTLLPGFLLFGIALGFVYSPMSIAAMEAMPRAKAGIAAGVLAMNRVLAGAVLLAATGAIFAALMDSHSATYSLAHALWAAVALCIIGAVLTFWLVADPPREPGTVPDHHHPHTLPH